MSTKLSIANLETDEIKELVEAMREELCDAEHYAKQAALYKGKDSRLADMYANLAKQELEHCNMEHMQVTRLITEYRESGHQPPEAMQAIWDWEHEQMVDHKAEIMAMLEMYKG